MAQKLWLLLFVAGAAAASGPLPSEIQFLPGPVNGLLVNGLYRHGFLLAPAMARQAADLVESNHADLRQRRSA